MPPIWFLIFSVLTLVMSIISFAIVREQRISIPSSFFWQLSVVSLCFLWTLWNSTGFLFGWLYDFQQWMSIIAFLVYLHFIWPFIFFLYCKDLFWRNVVGILLFAPYVFAFLDCFMGDGVILLLLPPITSILPTSTDIAFFFLHKCVFFIFLVAIYMIEVFRFREQQDSVHQ